MRAHHEEFGIRSVARLAPMLSQGHEVKASCAPGLIYSRDVAVGLETVLGVTFVGDCSGDHLR